MIAPILPTVMPPTLYLASASPRRAELLRAIGVDFAPLPADADEDAEGLEQALPSEAPSRYVVRVTRLKLEAARARLRRRGLPAAPILCADTTVALGRDILAKPADVTEARAMLARLQGRSHRVLTAVAVGWSDAAGAAHDREALSVNRVSMAALGPEAIDAYVASGEPFGKAGGYGIQGRAAAFIPHISGSHSGIMGLPLFETAQLLRASGILR